jgi:L-iditol 2-dehydrogenase
MKALRKLFQGLGHVELVDIPEPTPGETQVLVNVERAGICGTDLHILHGLFPKTRPPVTMGHEFSGVVSKVGTAVKDWLPGDRVTVESEAISCGRCRYCLSGMTNLCPERLALGYGMDGGFAPVIAVRSTALHRLPDHTTFQEGALCEPLSCAVHAVFEIAMVQTDDLVLVTGPGPIGLLMALVAKAAGARVVITGTEKDQDRLDVAAGIGADYVVRVDTNKLFDLVMDLTSGSGVDTAFECSGASAAISDSLACVARRGQIVQVGLSGRPLETVMDPLALKEITWKGCFVHNHETWNKAMNLLENKKVDLGPLVSGEFPLDDWQEAFRLSEEAKGLKYLLCPSADFGGLL